VLLRLSYVFGTAFNAVRGTKVHLEASYGDAGQDALTKIAEAVVRSINIDTILEDCPETPACAITVGGKTVIYVHTGLDDDRKAFLILHELGHLQLDHTALSKVGLDLKGATDAERKMFANQEKEANLFAGICLSLIDENYGLKEITAFGLSSLSWE